MKLNPTMKIRVTLTTRILIATAVPDMGRALLLTASPHTHTVTDTDTHTHTHTHKPGAQAIGLDVLPGCVLGRSRPARQRVTRDPEKGPSIHNGMHLSPSSPLP